MKAITVTALNTEIDNWFNWRFGLMPTLAQPFFAQGGWEGWIQTEIAMFLTGQDYDVMREANAYPNPNFRADLLLNYNCNDKLRPPIVIELKCQSIYLTGQAFIDSVERDKNKLETLDYRCKGLLMDFVVDHNTLNLFVNNGFYCRTNFQQTAAMCWKLVKQIT